MTLLILLTASLWVISELWIFTREKGKLDSSQDGNTKRTAVLSVFAGIALARIFHNLSFFSFPIPPMIYESFGILFMLCGILLRVWSVLVLGKYFRTTVMVQKDHKVITHGPKRLIPFIY